jgi:hypothetical protein
MLQALIEPEATARIGTERFERAPSTVAGLSRRLSSLCRLSIEDEPVDPDVCEPVTSIAEWTCSELGTGCGTTHSFALARYPPDSTKRHEAPRT